MQGPEPELQFESGASLSRQIMYFQILDLEEKSRQGSHLTHSSGAYSEEVVLRPWLQNFWAAAILWNTNVSVNPSQNIFESHNPQLYKPSGFIVFFYYWLFFDTTRRPNFLFVQMSDIAVIFSQTNPNDPTPTPLCCSFVFFVFQEIFRISNIFVKLSFHWCLLLSQI
jgi:hypothetical protein